MVENCRVARRIGGKPYSCPEQQSRQGIPVVEIPTRPRPTEQEWESAFDQALCQPQATLPVVPAEDQQMQEDQETEKKPRRKRNVEYEYNPVEDLLGRTANITFKQLIEASPAV